MVKSPGPKHSKPRKEPVTIDLDPKEVERKAAAGDQPASDPSRPESGAQKGAAGTDKPRSETPRSAEPKSEGGKSQEAKSSGAKPQSGSSAAASASAAGGSVSDKKPEPPQAGATSSARSGPASPSAAGATSATGASRAEPPKPAAGSDKKSTGPSIPPSGGSGSGGAVPPSGSRAAPPPSSGRGTTLLAGLAGGLIALLLVAVLQWAGFWPGGSAARESAAVAELRLQVDELRQTVAASDPALSTEDLDARIGEEVEAGLAPLREEIASLQASVGEAGGEPVDLQPFEARLDELEAAIAGLGDSGAPDAAVADVEERFSALEARLDAMETADGAADELAARMEELEQGLSAVQNELGERADEPRAALVIAASALKAAVDRGDAFQAELETYAALAPDADGLTGLGAYADEGVPTHTAILADLPDAADRMVAAGRDRQESDDLIANLWQSARDLVTVRPIGAVEGDSVEAIVARLEAAVRAGDYGTALSEYEQLPPAAQSAGADFMDRVRARHEIDTLVDEALTRALRAS